MRDVPNVSRVVDQVEHGLLSGVGYAGARLVVTFTAALAPQAVSHGIPGAVIPDGYELTYADAPVWAAPDRPWTTDAAYLMTDRAGAVAKLRFIVSREEGVPA